MKQIPSPEAFFGFKMGADGKLARWDRIVEYFRVLEAGSDKIKVFELGRSTEGNPFLLVIISSPENLADLGRLSAISRSIADPRGLSEGEVRNLVQEGKAVICQSMSLHATEVGGTQMASELAYELLTDGSIDTNRILEEVVFLMVPCFNPDGQIMVVNWYNKWLKTEYDGCPLPWLYHKYVGHDNNRDAFMLNMVESQYMAKILFREWVPQAYVDHHHMMDYGARFYIPPYCDPIHPYVDPIIWREHDWFGAHMAVKLEEAGKTGILNGAQFPGWGHLGFHWITPCHNIAGMLTESASAKLATPIYIHYSQLKAGERGLSSTYEPQTRLPNPWPGGWWRLRDVVEQQKIVALAALDLAAKNRKEILWNMYLKASRQIKKGEGGKPYAFVIPQEQHDPLTAFKMLERLSLQGIEIQRAEEDFKADRLLYPKGTYAIFLQQPKMGIIRTLLERTLYVDNEWTRGREGKPLEPFDTATDTLSEYMGVQVIPVDEIHGEFGVVKQWSLPEGGIAGGSKIGYLLDTRLNDAYIAVNRLLTKGVRTLRVEQKIIVGDLNFPPGSFFIPSQENVERILKEVAGDLHLTFHALKDKVGAPIHVVKPLRVGMYQRYYDGNIDEGWTRWLLEQFEFPYTTVTDKGIKDGNLAKKYDVLILPDDPAPLITGENVEEYFDKRYKGKYPLAKYPPKYKSGIGKKGVENLKKFVEAGGRLVAFNQACDLPIEKFKLPLRNVLATLDSKDFYCPGSTMRALVDNSHPVAYGMPEESLILFWESAAFEVLPTENNERYEIVVSYPDSDILQSGWLVGEKHLSRKAALVSASLVKGKVILIGFRTQHRAQTHGTFKLLFNTLLS
jgi:hypothetical protein